MNVLVTGSEGFVGMHLRGELENEGHSVVGVDIRNDALLQDVSVPANVERLLAEHEPDVVVHLAAKVGRLFGEDDLTRTILDNAAMTANVAWACGELSVPLVYASTSEVYGDIGPKLAVEGWGWDSTEGRPTDECRVVGDALPHNLYGLSKGWGEEACRLYAPDNLTIIRLSMPYGPGLPAGRGRAAIVNMLYDALWDRPLCVHKQSERSWCWVGDTVHAIRLLIEGGHHGAFNVGRDDNALPMRRVAEMACDLVGADHSLIYEVDAPARQTVVKRLSTSKIRGLGWEPTVELEDGMRRTLDWVKTLAAPDRVAA